MDADVERLRRALPARAPAPAARVVVMLCGLPGVGKSTLARRLAARTGYLTVESDALRAALFAPPTYSPLESARLFRAVHALLGRLLAEGVPLIFDATNLREVHRQEVYKVAAAAGATVVPVWVDAPEGVVRQRLDRRVPGATETDLSEADWAVYQRYKKEVEPVLGPHVWIDTSQGDLEQQVQRVLESLPG